MDVPVTHPFGTRISADDILDALGFLDDWESRYRYLIDLGRELPGMPAAQKTEDALIRGCQSQVWLHARAGEGKLWFDVDSDAFIVKGLLAVVLAAFNGKTPAQILAFDIDDYFARLDLLAHLSPTRGNGLRAMVARIREIAAAQEPA